MEVLTMELLKKVSLTLLGAVFLCVSLSFGASSDLKEHSKKSPEWSLPVLAPMPEIPPAQKPGTVPVGDPDTLPDVKMNFPIADGPYQPTWESISDNYPGEPDWLRQAKFGIWVHFGAQSAGQSGDWYARRLYQPDTDYRNYYDNHLKNFGHPSEVGYKDVLRTWNPDKLNPADLVQTYYNAGARFLFIQGVHHDNFDNWNSKYQPWNSVNIGPKRDLLAEWTKAARAAGMYYGVAFHHEYTWWWYQPAFAADKTGPKAGLPYDGNLTIHDGKGTWWEGYDPRLLYTVNLREYEGIDDIRFTLPKGIFTRHEEYAIWYATWWAYRIMDVIENYDPDFIYTDGNSTQPFSGYRSGSGMKSDAAQRLIAHYYNRTLQRRGKVDTFSIVKFHPPANGIVNTQEGRFPEGIKTDQPWIGETPVGDWFYTPNVVYDAGMVIRYLLECVCRDGNAAICISLLPDGSLDEGSRRMLRDVGYWMAVNGEGIYGSKSWKVFAEGEKVDGKLKVLPRGKLGKRQAEFAFTPQDFRFTVGKDGALYAFCLTVPPAGSTVRIVSLGTQANLFDRPVVSVTLLGHKGADLQWKQQPDALVITTPDEMPFTSAISFRIE